MHNSDIDRFRSRLETALKWPSVASRRRHAIISSRCCRGADATAERALSLYVTSRLSNANILFTSLRDSEAYIYEAKQIKESQKSSLSALSKNPVIKRGRPRKRWLDNITEDCEELNLTIHQASRLANDRVKWRNTVRNKGSRSAGTCLRHRGFKSK